MFCHGNRPGFDIWGLRFLRLRKTTRRPSFAYTQSAALFSSRGVGGGVGGGSRPSREGESPGNEAEVNSLLVINYHVHNSTCFTRKMFSILTTRSLACLF